MANLSPHESSQLISQENSMLLDVREPAEYNRSHIAHSQLAPLSRLSDAELPNDSQHVVVYCQKGVRAAKAINALQQRYPQKTFYNLEGGIDAWQENGLPITKGHQKGIALDRQVQLTIGTCVLASSILAAVLSPYWLLFTGFFGAGLIFAGTTGTCGLALVMARMPWNQ